MIPAIKTSMPPSLTPSTLDLVQANLFQSRWDQNGPTFPILQELGDGPIHRVTPMTSPVSIPDLIRLIPHKLIRSDMLLEEDGDASWKSVLFRSRGGGFVQWSDDALTVYAARQDHAARLARRLRRMIMGKAVRHQGPGYRLIKKVTCDVESEFVPMRDAKPISEENISLLYGETLKQWHIDFLEKFRSRNSGITILEGPPGCGKTSYIRGLIATLYPTHRFYFVPPHDVGLLTEPEFITFWSKERDRNRSRRMVLVLEDAEQALESRANDNRTLVSTLLNYSDGLLSEFLKMQILCTVNCSATRLDQALLRPGRLLARRTFGRLSRNDAERIAGKLGLTLGRDIDLQVDYSLAEIFNESIEENGRKDLVVGFANR
jgi:ATPase family associated with various cellular activities (AAA)